MPPQLLSSDAYLGDEQIVLLQGDKIYQDLSDINIIILLLFSRDSHAHLQRKRMAHALRVSYYQWHALIDVFI